MPKTFLIAALCLASPLAAQTSLVLKNAFIESVKNRATIDTKLSVDHLLRKVHPISRGGNDGDIHVAARSDGVGLPLVAEIMNAGREAAAMKSAGQAEGGSPIPVTGAWRIWFEHAGGANEVQGDPVAPSANSNPDHVFEIHPVTKFASNDVADSYVPIPGYTAFDAATAFTRYERLQATVQATNTATTISTTQAGYNYAEFIVQLGAAPTASDDGGLLVLGQIMKDAEEPLIQGMRRMVFVPGTHPADVARHCAAGAQLHVMGIPRVNLERISFLAAQQPANRPFRIALPYEMIVVAVFPESETACAAA